jgi:hypothetical protein
LDASLRWHDEDRVAVRIGRIVLYWLLPAEAGGDGGIATAARLM